MLRMRNGISKSPFRPRLSRQPITPRPPCGRCWTRQKDAEPNIAHKWLDGVSDVLADFLRRLRKKPSATAKIRPDLRLPGTTGLRFALPGRQRWKVFPTPIITYIEPNASATTACHWRLRRRTPRNTSPPRSWLKSRTLRCRLEPVVDLIGHLSIER